MKTLRSLSLIQFALACAFSVVPSMHGSAAIAAHSALQATSPEEKARIAQLLDKHIESFCNPSATKKFSWLPGYYVKKNENRIEGATALADCIHRLELQLIFVPEKWLYKVPENFRSHIYPKSQDQHLVVVQDVPGFHDGIIDYEQAKQLCTLLKAAQHNNRYYWDLFSDNILHLADGKIALIDSELRGFNAESPANGLRALATVPMTDDAKALVNKELEEYPVYNEDHNEVD